MPFLGEGVPTEDLGVFCFFGSTAGKDGIEDGVMMLWSYMAWHYIL